MTDQLHKFMFSAAPVRGELVSLQASWQEVLRRRAYPEPVKRLLGEMMAAAALLSANLKFDGALIMQLHGDGPVQMLVVECNADLSMRATARIADGAIIAEDARLADLVNVLGHGRFAITLDPQNREDGQQPYQGIVPLTEAHRPLDSIAAILEHYMRTSEQLETRLWLAADDQTAAGLLLQRLPDHGGTATPGDGESADDAWQRIAHLGATLQREELLGVEPETLLRRLFLLESEEHGVRVFEPRAVRFACSCSRTRVANMLRALGIDEIESIIGERGQVDIDCDFCGQHYTFDPVDCAQLFIGPAADTTPPPVSRH